MDKETREFIEQNNKALVEEIANIVHDLTTAMESRMQSMEKSLRDDIAETKEIVTRIDERTQHQVEAIYEEIRITQREVAKIDRHLGFQPPFTVAA